MEHFYHFCFSERAKEKKDKHLSAISCCLLNITKGPCVGPNVPKMKSWWKGAGLGHVASGWGKARSSAAGPGLVRAMLLFCPLFPFISPFLFFFAFCRSHISGRVPKGQQHKCRKFEWTSAVNEICKYFSKIELLWQIFCVRRLPRWTCSEGSEGSAGWRFMKISEEN